MAKHKRSDQIWLCFSACYIILKLLLVKINKQNQMKEIQKKGIIELSAAKKAEIITEIYFAITDNKIVKVRVCEKALITEGQFYNYMSGKSTPNFNTILRIIFAVRQLGGELTINI